MTNAQTMKQSNGLSWIFNRIVFIFGELSDNGVNEYIVWN